MFNFNRFTLAISCCFFAALGASQLSAADVCWKDSYGRGVGTVPAECNIDTQSKSGLLCYPKCKPGYKIVAGVCWRQCPEGWRDDGAFCKKPDSYSRGTLWFSENNCKKANPQGCERSWGAIYPKCKPGYVAHVATECSPKCPAGMKDIGISCQKDSYVVRPITPHCGSKEYDAGLCYNKCKENFTGVGPVCWKKCPADRSVDCGAMCGKTGQDCLAAIGEQIYAVGALIGKIAALVSSAGGSAAGTAATEAAKRSAIEAIKEVAKKVAKDVAKKFVGASGKVLKEKIAAELKKNPKVPSWLADQLASMEADPDGFDYKKFLSSIDPVGITQVVEAFNREICK